MDRLIAADQQAVLDAQSVGLSPGSIPVTFSCPQALRALSGPRVATSDSLLRSYRFSAIKGDSAFSSSLKMHNRFAVVKKKYSLGQRSFFSRSARATIIVMSLDRGHQKPPR